MKPDSYSPAWVQKNPLLNIIHFFKLLSIWDVEVAVQVKTEHLVVAKAMEVAVVAVVIEWMCMIGLQTYLLAILKVAVEL